MKHPQKQHRLFLRMQVISEPGVPSNVPPGIFGSIAHAGDVHHAMHHSSRESPGGAEGVKGATADFVRFHCPLEAWRCPVWKESHLCNQAIHKRPFAEKRAKKRPALKHGFNIGRICAMKRLGDNYALAISTSLVKAAASFTARSARILRLTVMLCFFRPLMNVE